MRLNITKLILAIALTLLTTNSYSKEQIPPNCKILRLYVEYKDGTPIFDAIISRDKDYDYISSTNEEGKVTLVIEKTIKELYVIIPKSEIKKIDIATDDDEIIVIFENDQKPKKSNKNRSKKKK